VQKDGTLVGTIGPLDCESAAALVPEPLAGRLRAFAEKEDELTFAEIAKHADRANRTSTPEAPLWKTGYSAGTQASTAMFYLARYEQVKKAPYREALLAIADKYLDSVPEEDLEVWPLAFAHAISTQVAAYRLTEQQKYLDDAERLAFLATITFWQDKPLPRASSKTGHYEAITGGDSLALALLQLHAVQHQLSVEIPANTIDR
jgi:hypothetical protein